MRSCNTNICAAESYCIFVFINSKIKQEAHIERMRCEEAATTKKNSIEFIENNHAKRYDDALDK